MRSNRPNYASTPAGSARALDQKPKPKRSKREFNQLMLMVFFIVLPVIGVLAVFLQPVRWLFMLLVILAIAAMWLLRAFLFPGRMILSAVYGLVLIFTLVTALGTQSNTNKKRSQNMLLTPIPVIVTPTPGFASMYSTMGTSASGSYYASDNDAMDDSLDSMTQVDDFGSADSIDLEDGSVGNGGYVSDVKSDAEIALENFMEKWRKGVIADMVDYTAKTWQNALTQPAPQQLFWKFAQRPLTDWRQLSAPSGTNESTARTITIQADVNYSGETRTYQYDAIVLSEEGVWAVDPDSLSSGILVESATPTPDPNATPTPEPTPSPTPAPAGTTKLYYNKDGGKRYHADPNCSSLAARYKPLKSYFVYKDIKKDAYKNLEPCKDCNAPGRP